LPLSVLSRTFWYYYLTFLTFYRLTLGLVIIIIVQALRDSKSFFSKYIYAYKHTHIQRERERERETETETETDRQREREREKESERESVCERERERERGRFKKFLYTYS
jgi:hypothetical protein